MDIWHIVFIIIIIIIIIINKYIECFHPYVYVTI